MKESINRFLKENSKIYFDMSDRIWDFAELSFNEVKTAAIQAEYLKSRGFKVTENAGGVPCAIVAECGEGRPIIGIFGELDALPNQSQVADLPEQKPEVVGGNGHGCGHHLLGVAAIAACDALKTEMEQGRFRGTVRYYGCPAEEYGSGKVHMLRAGLMKDLDAAISWHPMPFNALMNENWLVTLMLRYVFHGVSANPGHSAHLGRSALDAAELMGIGTQYLREHVRNDVKVHYAYQNSGGVAANVIPSLVEVNYTIRATKTKDALEVRKRLDKIAQGAALMTETTQEGWIHNAYYEYCDNKVMDDVILKNMHEAEKPVYTTEETEYITQFRNATSEANIYNFEEGMRTAGVPEEVIRAEIKKPISDHIFSKFNGSNGSTDFSDVSQNVPAGLFCASCFAIGCPPHSWQACATGKSAIAHKGELYAAEVMAGAAMDLFSDPELLKAAQDEFDRAHADNKYECVIPENIGPHGYEY